MKNSLLIFTPWLLRHFHPVHWDQTKELACRSLESRPSQVQELFTLVAWLFGTICRCLSVQPFQLLPSRNTSRHISLTWPFLHKHHHDRWPVDVIWWRKCFINFAVEHWLVCRSTEPGFTGEIGAVEIWLIDYFHFSPGADPGIESGGSCHRWT